MLSGMYGAIVAKKLPPLQILRLRWDVEFLRLRVAVRQRRRRDEHELLQRLHAGEDLRAADQHPVVARTLRAQIDERWLYHCDPYAKPGYTVWLWAGLLVLGCMQSFSLLFLMPNRPITLFSQVGQSTLPVYLLHGILVKYADCRGWLQALPLPLLAAAMTLLLCSRPVARGFQMLQNLPSPSRKSK